MFSNPRTIEFYRLLPIVAAHFNMDNAAIKAAIRAATTGGAVSQHALDCYRAIVRSL